MVGRDVAALSVLIVDDNTNMRKLIASVLMAFGGIQTMEASDPEQAWVILQKRRPDVMILDWELGRASGLDLARRVRKSPDTVDPFLPIIMLTAHSHAERVREARDAGVNEFLTKPVSTGAIYARLIAVSQSPRPYVRTGQYFGPDRRRTNSEEYSGPERRGGSKAPKED